MKKKPAAKINTKSLKTFFLYSAVVFFIILIALSIKAIFIIRHNKFVGNSIAIVVASDKKVTRILGFNESKNSISVLNVKNYNIPITSVGKSLGIITGGTIESKSNLSNESIDSTLLKTLVRKNKIKTNLTIFDLTRLILVSKKISAKDTHTEEINEITNEQEIDKIASSLFEDDVIRSENLSIEIVNATDSPGLGKRLERCLTNMGANVVAVTTPHLPENLSIIQYSGDSTYTVDKLKNILNIPAKKISEERIAKIVIIIGKDRKNTSVF